MHWQLPILVFLVDLDILTKTLFSERSLMMMTMKTSSCLLCLPIHNTAMMLCWCLGNCHHALFLPCTSLPYAPLLGRGGRQWWRDDDPRGDDNVHDVPPCPPNTQQPAILGGGEDCNGNWDGDGNGDGDSNGDSNGNGDGDWQWQQQQQRQQQNWWWWKWKGNSHGHDNDHNNSNNNSNGDLRWLSASTMT